MKSLSPHLTGPGFVAIEVTAADEPAAAAAAQTVGPLWWSSGPSALYRTPDEDGVRVRLYADVRRAPDGQQR
ncbi:hypothetical protein C3486_26845 [Streptomyces sp. Ru73]|uniref:DUF6207 family protein n=1 Tax=Streptomyces sp. Ru73 TaxID=2080748 RepID=UPI000CDCFFA0|nr:DUF6207 family protein [Streptomyces sp. Ru73]POX37712.1 hypothetical protein C3486_26845 [Streptomyces sp. Ru73]